MRNKLIALISITFLFISAIAQENHKDGKGKGDQKIKALYIAYMTEQLNLNENEAQKFWPIHRDYNSEMKSIRKENGTELEREEASLNIKKKYNDRFLKILGKERTEDFYKKDREFREKLVKKIKEKRFEKNQDIPREEKRHRP
jgi:Spy/CpxP family protein refolding chaperone